MRKKSIRCSVLICTYNGSEYIKDQLMSILNQTTPIDEIFIFDFGSTDGTVDAIQEIKSSHSDTIFLERLGNLNNVARSFIMAIKSVREKIEDNTILYICDQDDFWKPNKNSVILRLFTTKFNYPVLIHHDVQLTDKNLNPIDSEFYSKTQKNILQSNISHREFFSTTIGHTVCLNFDSVSLIAEANFNKDIKMHDWYWSILVERKGEIVYIDEKLSLYRQHDKNVLGVNKSNYWLKKTINSLRNSVTTAKQRNYINSRLESEMTTLTLLGFLVKNFHFKELISFGLIFFFSSLFKTIYKK